MAQTSRRRIQERGTRLLALSLILPISAFLFTGYMLVSYIVSEKDNNTLRNLALTVRQLESQRLNQYNARHSALADSLLQFPQPSQSQYLERLAINHPDLIEAHSITDSTSLHQQLGLPTEETGQLYRMFQHQAEGVGHLRRQNRMYILSFSQLDHDNEFMVILWKTVPVENIYVHALKDFNLLDIDYNAIMTSQPDINEDLKALIQRIFLSADQTYIQKEDPSDLAAYYFIKDVTGRPLAITTMRTERYFLNQMRRLFWLGGITLSFFSILLATLLSHRVANYIVNPVEKLALEMNRIAADPINSEELSQRQYPELEMVINSFNGILRSFKSYFESVLKFQTIVTNLQEGIFWSNEDGRLIISNDAFMRVFEREADNLPDLFFWKPEHFYQRISQFFDGREFIIGERVYLLFVNEITVDGSPNFLGLISDITQQKEHEEARKKLELELAKARTLADLGLLIEGISHNLNGPLHNILGYVHLLLDVYPDNRDLNRIQANGIRMADIIKSLMNRMGEEMVFAPRPIDVNELVRRELDFFDHNLYFKNNVQKRIELAPNLPLVMAVYSDISQSVANLISNAVDALKVSKRKELCISTELCEKGMRITVEDTGVGIPADKLETIFESFYSTKTQDDTTGAGLGLSISRQLLSAYGAQLLVNSELGRGSRFSIVIPSERFADSAPVGKT
ncbi:MAG: hypothetical protein K8R90_00125 [Candidatus Cloacimonetes bacterium]|nr:hypothetical protein [Candidatus Cloacimonadota bacterium]